MHKRIIVNRTTRDSATKKVNGKRTGVFKKPVTDGVPKITTAIFLTGGIGDVLAIESHFPDSVRKNLKTIYYATNKTNYLEEIFNVLPNYDVNHISVWSEFKSRWCFHSKKEWLSAAKKIQLTYPSSAERAEDFSIFPIFPLIHSGSFEFKGSSLLKYTLASVDQFNLPEKYVVICPFSSDKRKSDRDLSSEEFQKVVNFLSEKGIKGIVLNRGSESVPEHETLVNLSDKTTFAESVEILKRATGFIGIDSCLSVLAAQLFDSNRLAIKCNNSHGMANKYIYWAPHKTFKFLNPELDLSNFSLTVSIKRTPKEITLITAQGLGDIFWVYQKMSPYFDRINIKIGVTSLEDKVQLRSKEWIESLPKIGDVTITNEIDYGKMASKNHSMIEVIDNFEKGMSSIPYCCNKWLEEGVDLDKIDPTFQIERNIPLKLEKVNLPFEKYITLYVSGSTKMHGAAVLGAWPLAKWISLVEGYNLNKLPIVIIGAFFDKEVIEELNAHFISRGINTFKFIQQTPAEVCYILKNTECFIGYQSGLNIVADNMDVNQIMLYYEYLKPMLNTWCKPENIDKKFNAFTFTQKPEEVLSILEKREIWKTS